MRVWLPVLLSVACCGCMFQSEGTAKKLTDTLENMNKATRWGQLVEAERMVEPVYRPRFLRAHAHWGQTIQVADSEVVQMQMSPDQETAIAAVSYDWYLISSMTLHTTIVQQRWSNIGETFLLVSESVVQGDPRLLTPSAKQSQPGEQPPAADGAGTLAPDEVSMMPPM